jgi:hypothetical protein
MPGRPTDKEPTLDYFENLGLYAPRAAPFPGGEPRNDWERTEQIMRMLGRDPATIGSPAGDAADYGGYSPSLPPASESLRGAGTYRREYLPPEPPRDAINSLGDEMVLWAGGLVTGRALPFAVQMGRQGVAAIRGLTPQAERAIAETAQSWMNRLGRLPMARELIEALGPVAQPPSQDQPYTPEQTAPPDAIPERWPVTEVQRLLGEAKDSLRGLGGKSFQSYTKQNSIRDDIYAGLTGGTGGPESNVARRDRYKYPSAEYHRAKIDRSSEKYSSIRGCEQQLIDHFRRLGISANKINSISLYNILRNYYMRNAEAEFGLIEDPEADNE